MSMTEINALIKRIEAGETGREVAGEVLQIFGWRTETIHDTIIGSENVWQKPGQKTYGYAPPNPLVSLDAAIAEIPSGYWYSLQYFNGICRATVEPAIVGTCISFRALSKKPAVALTLVLLKLTEWIWRDKP